MTAPLPLTLGAAASDILTSYTSPVAALGGAGLSAVAAKLLRKRLETARQILLEELRKGEKSLYDLDEVDALAAITFRYARAAQEGTARLNLRLMAKVIAGKAQAGPLVADEFLAWADVLASLRREEVVLITAFGKAVDEWRENPQEEPRKGRSSMDLWKIVESRLVPDVFPNRQWMRSAACASLRTGFLISSSGLGGGEGYFFVSPLFDELRKTVSFQDALREEES